MGVGAMILGAGGGGAGFMLRSISGGGDIEGDEVGTMMGRGGTGRGAVTTTGPGDEVGGMAETGAGGTVLTGGEVEGTPDIAEAHDVRCEINLDDTEGSNEGEAIKKDCTCWAAATNPCWNLRASCRGS